MLISNSLSGSPYSKNRQPNKVPKSKGFLDEFEEGELGNETISDSHGQADEVLNEYITMLRLKLSKLNYNQKIPQKVNRYSGMLVDAPENRGFKKICPQCQLIYRKNSMVGQSMIPYLEEDEKVNISI